MFWFLNQEKKLVIPFFFVINDNKKQLTIMSGHSTGKEVEMVQFRVGDKIIYHKPKSSCRPGLRAKQVYPLEHGEAYHYVVDKY